MKRIENHWMGKTILFLGCLTVGLGWLINPQSVKMYHIQMIGVVFMLKTAIYLIKLVKND